jgi:hypothetical protein
LTLSGDSVRDGVVESWDARVGGSVARKLFSMLMVRGMPLKEMHLRPTSRRNSAAQRGSHLRIGDWDWDWDSPVDSGGLGEEVAGRETSWWSTARESGEFIVMVAAADMARKGDRPTFLAAASSWRDL